jgi:hypothetical protein
VQLLVDQELGAANTYAVQYVHDHRKELDEIHGSRELIMTKVARAVMVRLTTAAARLAIVENTHARIKEAADTGLVAVIGACICDFDY